MKSVEKLRFIINIQRFRESNDALNWIPSKRCKMDFSGIAESLYINNIDVELTFVFLLNSMVRWCKSNAIPTIFIDYIELIQASVKWIKIKVIENVLALISREPIAAWRNLSDYNRFNLRLLLNYTMHWPQKPINICNEYTSTMLLQKWKFDVILRKNWNVV